MVDLRRIRLDDRGIIVQDSRGKMERILLEGVDRDALRRDVHFGVQALLPTWPELGGCLDRTGRLTARFDLADEPTDCLTRPLRIYYNIEPRCNLHCAFCGPRDFHGLSALARPEREDFLLGQIAEAGTFQVQLTGGEIFLRGWDLFKTLERTAQLGLATLMGTNGVWPHIREREAFLSELAQFRHVIEIKVSVDGTPQFHDAVRGAGTYAEAVRTLFDLSRLGFTTRINTTIFRESCTLEQIEHVARLAKQANAALQAIPERSCGRSGGKKPYELPGMEELRAYTKRATELRDELKISLTFNFDIFGGGRQLPVYDPDRPFSCGAGLWGFAVTHLGEVYPCGFSMDIGEPPIFFAGVITEEQSLLDIWLRSPVLRRWRHAGKSQKCNQCAHYRHTCWGGCMIQAYVVDGSLNASDPYCIKQ